MNILIIIVGVPALLIGFALLMAKHKPDPNDFDKIEQVVNNHGAINKFMFSFVLFCIISTVIPGAWGVASLAQGQLLIGSAVLLIWAYPYWLFLNYLSNRSLLKMRLGFSIPLTLLVLAFAFFAGQTPNQSIKRDALERAPYVKRYALIGLRE